MNERIILNSSEYVAQVYIAIDSGFETSSESEINLKSLHIMIANVPVDCHLSQVIALQMVETRQQCCCQLSSHSIRHKVYD